MVACVRTLHRAVRPETDLWLLTSQDIRLWEAGTALQWIHAWFRHTERRGG